MKNEKFDLALEWLEENREQIEKIVSDVSGSFDEILELLEDDDAEAAIVGAVARAIDRAIPGDLLGDGVEEISDAVIGAIAAIVTRSIRAAKIAALNRKDRLVARLDRKDDLIQDLKDRLEYANVEGKIHRAAFLRNRIVQVTNVMKRIKSRIASIEKKEAKAAAAAAEKNTEENND